LGLVGTVTTLYIINFALTKYEGLSFDCSLFEGYSSSHIFDVLNYEINRNPIVSKAWNDYICIKSCGQYEISKRFFDKIIILFKHTDYTPSSLSSISFKPTAKSDVICILKLITITVNEYFIGKQVPYPFIVERHQAFKEYDICGTNVSRLFHTRMLYERILRNFNPFAALDKINQGFIGQIEIQGIRVIEIIFSNIDFSFIDTSIDKQLLL
jgi:hypothetical protein